MAPCNGTQQWHHTHSPKVGRHPPPPTIAHYNGTLQWHPAMAPPVHSPKVGRHPPPPTIAHYNGNGTQQWHHVHSPKVGRHPPTIAHYNGTQQWHHVPCNGTLVPRPIRQSGSSPSPLLEVRTPIAIAIWGKIWMKPAPRLTKQAFKPHSKVMMNNQPKHFFPICLASSFKITIHNCIRKFDPPNWGVICCFLICCFLIGLLFPEIAWSTEMVQVS